MKKEKLKITVIDHEKGYIGPSCVRGLQAIGHTVQLMKLKGEEGSNVFDLFDPLALLKEIIPFGPDLILDINGKTCDRDGILLSAYRILNIHVFIWFVDNPLIVLNYGQYNHSDLFTKLVYDKHQCEEMKKLGMTETYHLPLGADDNYFKPLTLDTADIAKYKTDISFVGYSYADKCALLRNVLRNRWVDMPKEMNDVIRLASENLKKGTKKSTPEIYQSALDYFRLNPIYPQEDIPWVINIIIEHESGRDYRAELIRPLLKYGIRIYGNKSWLMVLDKCSLHPAVDYFEDLPKVYNASLINLNISRTQLVTAVNQRVFDVPACMSFLLTDFKEELEEYFLIGKEIICYRDKEELNRLTGYYLSNPAQMRKIAEAGYQRVLCEHTYTDRMERLINIYENMPDNNYEPEEKGEAYEKANLFIGQAYLKLSNKEKAGIHFKKALIPGSKNYICRLNTVGVSFLQNKEYESSIPIFMEASALDKDESSFLLNLGLAYKKTGKYADAEYYYKKALEKDPSNTLIKKSLNDLYPKIPPQPPLEQRGGFALTFMNDLFMTVNKSIKEGEVTHGISLCMIVKNEEANLAQCIKSVHRIVSEVIVVDTGSEDRTIEIAREYGAQVYNFKWNDNFSDARNMSLDLATKDWILILDADEIIAERDIESLRLLCESKEYDAFSFLTRNYINDSRGAVWIQNDNSYKEGSGNSGWFPSRKVRLFRNDRRIRFSGVIHELVEDSVRNLKLIIGETAIPVHHYGAGKSGLSLREKRIKYINYCRMKIEEEPENPKAYYEYGIECCEYGLAAEAVEAFKKVLDINPDFPFVHGYLGASLITLGFHREAIVYLNQGINKEPDNPGLYNNIASAYYEIGDYDKAIIYYKKAIDLKPDYASCYKNIGLSYLKLDDKSHAVESLEKALLLNQHLDDVSMLLNELKKVNLKKPKLSLCMIVRNEEAVLKECLESVANIVDEIIVVDTGSIDDTLKIASSYGAKILQTEWKDDFSGPRNISIKNASGDYILWLDADEKISQESKDMILKLKETLPETRNSSNSYNGKAEAYSIIITSKRNNQINELNHEEESFRSLRIFPNIPGIEFKGKVHEDVSGSLKQTGIKVTPLDINVEHYGYRNDDEIRMKVKRNIPLLMEELALTPDDPLKLFYLANSFYCIGDIVQAIYYMDKARIQKGSAVRNMDWYPFAYVKLAQFYRESDKQDDAVKIYEELIALFPEFATGYFFLGEALFFQRRYSEALKQMEVHQNLNIEISSYPLPIKKMDYLKYYYSGCCLMEAGEYYEAAEYFSKALNIDPNALTLHISLSRLFALTRDLQSCVEACNKVLKYTEMNIDIEINSTKELSKIFDSIGESFEARSLLHEAMESYKTSLVLLADTY
ncbi:MAG: tetratricopeptide repeat protein [Nitrospirae bacterium]|nr:tetratricopeptide repeat protein [Nitrospirota bacterium]